jgi:hypothetical protein
MKVSIIGKGRYEGPYPLEGDIWGITQTIINHQVTKVIDMNDYTLWGEREAEDAGMARLMAYHNNIPYIDRNNYPLKDVIEHFGTDYFSNTVDYALALAIWEGYQEIDIYGVNMETDTEYAYQKPGVEFWVGVALGRGIKVNVHGQYSTIMKTKDGLLYGYGTPQAKGMKV